MTVLIMGPVGVGKTMLAHALGHLALQRDSVLCESADKLFQRLRGSRLDDTHDVELLFAPALWDMHSELRRAFQLHHVPVSLDGYQELLERYLQILHCQLRQQGRPPWHWGFSW